MTAALRPLREDEYAAFLEDAIVEYARDMVAHGGLAPDVARRKSEADHVAILPEGLATEGVALFAVESDGERVGHLFFAGRERFGSRIGFLYSIWIDPDRRGLGLGRRAMELLEAEARARGYSEIDLNVFGGNEPARSLYRSLGYREVAVAMGKTLP